MKTILRTLVVWLVLLAVPFQGLATAAMLPCAGCEHAPAMDRQVQATPPHAVAGQDKMHDNAADHHAKCSNCADSCVGVAIAPSGLAPVVVHAPVATSIPFDARHFASVDLDLPERPPRFAAA